MLAQGTFTVHREMEKEKEAEQTAAVSQNTPVKSLCHAVCGFLVLEAFECSNLCNFTYLVC